MRNVHFEPRVWAMQQANHLNSRPCVLDKETFLEDIKIQIYIKSLFSAISAMVLRVWQEMESSLK